MKRGDLLIIGRIYYFGKECLIKGEIILEIGDYSYLVCVKFVDVVM